MNRIILFIVTILLTTNLQAQTLYDGPDPFQLTGNVKEVVAHNNNADPYIKIQFNRDAKQITLNNYHKEGTLLGKRVLTTDEDGNVTKERYVTPKGDFFAKTYEYKNGKKTLEKVVHKGNIWVRKAYSYYQNDKVHQITTFHQDGSVDNIETYSYNKNKTTVNHTTGDGELNRTAVYTYDDHNNPIHKEVNAHVWPDSKSWSFSFSYEYDEHGNYTKYKMFKGDKLITTQEREITYM